jgi:predicted Zn finger-like uncharacterized protein
MAEIVNCPQCDRKLRVPDELLGKKVKCPTCGNTFNAEVEELSPAPPPAPRPEPRSPLGPPPGARRPREYDEDDEDDEEDQRKAALGRPRRRRRDARPHRGALILVLGILSIVTCQIFGPIAWFLGHNDLAEMRSGRMDREGQELTNAGRICGIIGTVLLVPCLCFGILAFIGALVGDQ